MVRKVGATHVHVVEDDASRAQLATWRTTRRNPVLVVRADQLVHFDLVKPLLATGRDAVAVVPEKPPVNDLTAGEYAGAFLVGGDAATDVIAALARGESDAAIVARISDPLLVPHGEIARAPIARPPSDGRAHVLYRILIKPQDNAITRYLYRPVSFPLTRLLVWTPITPNQISYRRRGAGRDRLLVHRAREHDVGVDRHGHRARRELRRLLRRRGRAREAAVVAVRRVDRHDRRRAVERRLHGRDRLALPSLLRPELPRRPVVRSVDRRDRRSA